MPDYDAIVIGAGHNGMAAATTLGKAGLKVLDVERKDYIGGLASTVELFEGFKHNIAACLFMFCHNRIKEFFEFKKYGLEEIETDTSLINFGHPDEKPFIMYSDINKLIRHMVEEHGEEASEGLLNLLQAIIKFDDATIDANFGTPVSYGEILDRIPKIEDREAVKTILLGSCNDVINQYFPRDRNHNIRGILAMLGIDGCDGGPYTPGTGFSFGYHLAMAGVSSALKIPLPRGGMVSVVQAMRRQLEEKGGEVIVGTAVKSILIENEKAVGVELANGEKITSSVVLSNCDPANTFAKLVGEEYLPSGFFKAVKGINLNQNYMQILCTLSELPEWEGDMAVANEGKFRHMVTFAPSTEHAEKCWDKTKYGLLPDKPFTIMFIPSVYDDSFAPPGKHSLTLFVFGFPNRAPRDQRKRLKEEMAENVIDNFSNYCPNLKDAIMDKVLLDPVDYEKMFDVTNGDFCQGAIQIDQTYTLRPIPGWSRYRTPVENLYLCGSGCHPGGGVTCIPGYNSANEVIKDFKG